MKKILVIMWVCIVCLILGGCSKDSSSQTNNLSDPRIDRLMENSVGEPTDRKTDSATNGQFDSQTSVANDQIDSQANVANSQTDNQTNIEDDSFEEAENKEIVFADDDFVTATFERLYDSSSFGVEGYFYVVINVKNKTDKEIWVYLDKASVNDEMIPLVTSGVPLDILPEKSGRNSFIFPFSALSIDSIDAIDTIDFDLVVADEESLDEIYRIKAISLCF